MLCTRDLYGSDLNENRSKMDPLPCVRSLTIVASLPRQLKGVMPNNFHNPTPSNYHNLKGLRSNTPFKRPDNESTTIFHFNFCPILSFAFRCKKPQALAITKNPIKKKRVRILEFTEWYEKVAEFTKWDRNTRFYNKKFLDHVLKLLNTFLAQML